MSENKNKGEIILACRVCGTDLIWEVPGAGGMCVGSSEVIECWDICHSCMVEHCTNVECEDCFIFYTALKQGGACRFYELKEHYLSDDLEENEDGEKQDEKEKT